MDVLILGAGPAGVMAALRAADLGARTTLLTSGRFGGMAANDGPVPVRTLAHAARLLRDAQQLGRYGIQTGGAAPTVDYALLLERVGQVVAEVQRRSILRPQVDAAGVAVHEGTGPARFVDSRTVQTASGVRVTADRIIVCTGGRSRRLSIPGFELTATHSDAWSLTSVPASMIVLGGGATGLQVASVFAAFGTRVRLFQAGPRILPSDDEEVAAAVANAFRARGIDVEEGFGDIERFERTPSGVRMVYAKEGRASSAEAALIVAAVGWSAAAEELQLRVANVATNERGFIAVDATGRTSAPHVYAAGDVTGGVMLAPQAMQAGFVAASAALDRSAADFPASVIPVGSFTDPEYAQVGLTEAAAKAHHDVLAVSVPFAELTRAVIDGRTTGFCKLVVDKASGRILGCQIVGERAVDIVQIAAVAMAAGMSVMSLARFPVSFPTYASIIARAAAVIAHKLNRDAAHAPWAG
jgi:dihydrolipoamide dehydrogenase